MTYPGNNPFQTDGNPFHERPELAARSRGCGWFLPVFCVLFLGGCALTAGLFFLVTRGWGATIPTEAKADPESVRADNRKAFAREKVNLPATEAASVQSLFRAIENAARAEDDAAFRKLVDRDRCLGIMRDACPAANPFERLSFQQQMISTMQADTYWHSCRLMAVKLWDDPDWMNAYVLGTSKDEQVMTYRFTLTRREKDVWKVADWQRLDLGLSHTGQWAIYVMWSNHSHLENYFEMCDHINQSDDHLDANERDRSKYELQHCEGLDVPSDLEAQKYMFIGIRWLGLGENDLALKWFQRSKNPDAAPGCWIGQAYAYKNLRQPLRALECATKYEELVGDDPDCSRLRAQILEGLRRNTEAVAEWRDVLRFLPNDSTACESIAESIPDDRLTELEQFVGNTSQPALLAEQLYTRFEDSRPAAAARMAEFIFRTEPESSRALYIDGCQRRARYDCVGAAEKFLLAAQKTDDQDIRRSYENDYIDIMREQGRLLEAYNQVSDPEGAFSYLAYSFDDGTLLESELLEVIEAHRIRAPDDFQNDYYASQIYLQRKQYTEAEKFVRSALQRAKDEDDIASLNSHLVSVLTSAGRALEAYRTIPPSDERFRDIAETLESRESWDVLQELITEHAKEHADDAWLKYYKAIILRKLGQPKEAWDLIASAIEQKRKEDLSVTGLRFELLSVAVELDRLPQAYELLRADETDIHRSAGVLPYVGNKNAFPEWIELHRKHAPKDPVIREWEHDLLWKKADYDGLIKHFGADPLAAVTEVSAYERQWRLQQYCRALLRTDRLSEAADIATKLSEKEGDLLPSILVCAKNGQVEKTQQLIDWLRPRDQYIDDLLDDDDIGEILQQKEYAAWRAKHPALLSSSYESGVTFLFLREPDTRSLDELKTTLRSSLGEEVVVEASGNEESKPEEFVIRLGDRQLLMRRGDNPHSAALEQVATVKDESLSNTCAQHKAWIALAELGREGDDGFATQSKRVASGLLNEACLAIWLVDDFRLLPNSSDLKSVLGSDLTRKQLSKLGAEMDAVDSPVITAAENTAFRRDLHSLYVAFHEGRANRKLEVQARISNQPVEDEVTVNIESAKFNSGSHELTGRLTKTSPLVTGPQLGELVRLNEEQVHRWRYRDDDRELVVKRPAGTTAASQP
jgi:hypothetical protein